jgi:hypothetical protein
LLSGIYTVTAQSSVAFEKRMIDLGKILIEDGEASADFKFKSVGRDYLMIKDVQNDNADLSVRWDKRIYQRGKEGVVSVSFEPQREGIFKRKITLQTNGVKRNTFILTVKGEVVKTGSKSAAQQAKSAKKSSNPTTFSMPSAYDSRTKTSTFNPYMVSKTADGQTLFPIVQHGFGLSSRVLDFKKIRKGDKPTITIKIKNHTGTTRDIYFAPLFEYVEYKATPKTLKPDEEGEVSLTFDSKKCPIWGQYQAEFSLITDVGSTAKNSPVLFFKVDIFEDFNLLTDEEKANAPRVTFDTKSVDLGQIEPQKKRNIKFTFANRGKNSLQIRKIINNVSELRIINCDGTVSAGKSGVLELELDATKQKAGSYSKKIILQTNDPKNPSAELSIKWEV